MTSIETTIHIPIISTSSSNLISSIDSVDKEKEDATSDLMTTESIFLTSAEIPSITQMTTSLNSKNIIKKKKYLVFLNTLFFNSIIYFLFKSIVLIKIKKNMTPFRNYSSFTTLFMIDPSDSIRHSTTSPT